MTVATRKIAPTRRQAQETFAPEATKTRGRKLYLDDDLFERILVQAHRNNQSISEYASTILDRHVPDHRAL